MASALKVDLTTGLRRMVYAVSPNETSFENPRDVPEYINEVRVQCTLAHFGPIYFGPLTETRLFCSI